MSIKIEIGRRIFDARKAKGLTRKALADLTDDLKPSRINNWERGMRTPGPEEIKQLSKVLDVSPSFLMCLTNQKQSINNFLNTTRFIPLLDATEACNAISSIPFLINAENHATIPIDVEMSSKLSKYGFALKMQDDSMTPELRCHDVLIVDPSKLPQPGNFVIAKLEDNTEVIVRRYKQVSASKNNRQFELLSTNTHWADVKDSSNCIILGTICGLNRMLA